MCGIIDTYRVRLSAVDVTEGAPEPVTPEPVRKKYISAGSQTGIVAGTSGTGYDGVQRAKGILPTSLVSTLVRKSLLAELANLEIAWLMLYKKVALEMGRIRFCQLQRVLYRHSRVGGSVQRTQNAKVILRKT